MANVYVRSTDGSNSDNGTTWALAKLDLHTATTGGLATAGAGGTCYVSDAHAGSYSVAIPYSGGTLASPIKVICGDDAAEPPTTLTNTATESTSGNGFTFTGAFYFKGVTFTSTYGSTQDWAFNGYTGPFDMVFEDCQFNAGAGSAGQIKLGYASLSANDKGLRLLWDSVDLKLPASTASTLNLNNVDMVWKGGAFITNGTLPNYLFVPQAGFSHRVVVEGVDLSVLSGKTLVSAAANNAAYSDIRFVNCKLPASITLSTTPLNTSQRVAMYNCDSGVTGAPTRMEVQTYAGGIFSERTLIRTGGASDGTTGHSWKFVTNANAEFPTIPLRSDPIYVWNGTTGSSRTVTVELLHDSVTALTDQEVWLEVSYLNSASYPTAKFSTIDNPLSSASNLTTSSETWTTTGMSNPNKQYVSVSFTPQLIGYVSVVICVGKASKTLYACPKVTLA